MADLIQIANLSLARIGTRSTISDLAEDSPEARGFNLVYGQCRDETLEAVDWGFARARRVLADLGTPPAGWSYRYAYPTDCLKIRAIEAGVASLGSMFARRCGAGASNLPPVPYEAAIDLDAQGNDLKVIYSDLGTASLVFTRRITSTELFTPGFIAALSWSCGAQLAVALTGSSGLMQICLNQWRLSLAEAAATDANEGLQQQNVLPDWIRAR